jgi:gentisate 1,2-dioxygenase
MSDDVHVQTSYFDHGVEGWEPKHHFDLEDDGVVRTFSTGATRDTEEEKLDYEAFLSPTALRIYASYLHLHRRQSDGTLRSGDNWQKGIPIEVYQKSRWRHHMDAWLWHRAGSKYQGDLDDRFEALGGILFNTMGEMHELAKAEGWPTWAK